MTIFAPLYCLCFFVRDQLTVLCGSIYGLCSVPVVYLSILLPISHRLNYYSFIVASFRVSIFSPSILLFNIVLAIMGLSPLHINFRISYPQTTLLRFWSEWHWIYRSNWEELTSWQYWLFLFRNTNSSPFIWFLFDFIHQSFVVFLI